MEVNNSLLYPHDYFKIKYHTKDCPGCQPRSQVLSIEVALGARGFLSLLGVFHPRVSRTPKAEFSNFVYSGYV